MSEHRYLPDTRPYPAEPVKRELLMHAEQAARGGAQGKLAAEALRAQIYGMLSQNFYLNLSVALSMTPSETAYGTMMAALNDVLQAKTDEEIQWFALPVILVAGCKQAAALTAAAPAPELSACLANYPHTRALSRATWLPQLFTAGQISEINAGQWFKAKQNAEAAAEFAASLPQNDSLPLVEGQSVSAAFALGYGGRELTAALGKNLQEAALPLMQVWQQALSAPGVTLFANPLSPDSPPCVWLWTFSPPTPSAPSACKARASASSWPHKKAANSYSASTPPTASSNSSRKPSPGRSRRWTKSKSCSKTSSTCWPNAKWKTSACCTTP